MLHRQPLATQLGLPIADKRSIAGVGGAQVVNMHLAQVHVPTLNFTMYGLFAGVHLAAGGQAHGEKLPFGFHDGLRRSHRNFTLST